MEIDILIPTYNGQKYICQQIDSLLNQSYPNINIIIRDDCSIDSTYEILCEKYNRYSNVKILVSDIRGGYNANFNYLLNYSKSDIVFLCDQDDIWLPNKINDIIKEYNILDSPQLISHDVSVIDSESKPLSATYIGGLSRSSTIFMDTFINTVQGCTISMNKKFKDMIKDIGFILPYDNTLGMAAKVINAYKYLDKKYIDHRRHDSNASSGLSGFTDNYCKYRVTDIITSATYVDEYIRICKHIKSKNGSANDDFINILEKIKNNKFKLINKISIDFSRKEINTDNYEEVKQFYLSVINHCEEELL